MSGRLDPTMDLDETFDRRLDDDDTLLEDFFMLLLVVTTSDNPIESLQ
jgi:hypothetical protein